MAAAIADPVRPAILVMLREQRLDQSSPAAGWERRLDALQTEVYRTRRERRQRDTTDQGQENTA